MDPLYSGVTAKGAHIVIRYPTFEDAEKMCMMINELSQERTFITYQGEVVSLEEERQYVEEQLKKIAERRAVQLLVFCEDELAGIASVDFLMQTQRHIGEFGIAIRACFRKLGIGTILMKTLFNETLLVKKDLRILILHVFSTNIHAIDLYKKFGFIEYGRLPRGVLLEEGCVDRVSMYKPLFSV